MAKNALSRFSPSNAQVVGTVDDEHPDAGSVCPSVHWATSLLFLVRTDPAQLALRLPSVSPGKNGRIAAEKVRTRLTGFLHGERGGTSLSIFVGKRFRNDPRFFASPGMTL